MNTFFKTFFVCLVLAFGFLGYKYVSIDSYSSDLNVSKNNPIFGIHENLPDATAINNQVENKQVAENKNIKKDEKYIHKCYFFSNNGELIQIKREFSFKPSLENAITILLKGPLISETKKGIYSEIPANVDLIEIRNLDKDIIVDLSSNFGNGGGSNSVTNRVKQLSKTVKLYEPNKNVYLYINGKEIEYLGGDGVYIKQPLN